jgi:peptidoglycan/LPS O-acetylase OafA/YrhL
MKRPRLAAAAALTGIAAVLVAGYAAAGLTGLVDVAAVTALGVLIAARGALRGENPRAVRQKDLQRRPAVRTADFPAFTKIASDLEWARPR